MEYTQTLFAMIGSSGRSVKFVVAYTYPDESAYQERFEKRVAVPVESAGQMLYDQYRYVAIQYEFALQRDTELYLTRFRLINIDEFDQVSARHQGFLKHLLQKPVVNVRKPHATQVESVKRYASFIATSNHTDLLGHPSGSRRFICIEVKGLIDNDQPIDYLQLYAQAVAALKNNERYWLTHEEEVSQMQANEAFQQRPLFEDLFFQYYRLASHKEEGLKISAGEIYLSLQKKSGVKLPMSNVSVFGRFLKKIGLKTRLASRGRLYLGSSGIWSDVR